MSVQQRRRDILKQLEALRRSIVQLEEELKVLEVEQPGAPAMATSWPPPGFYGTFYVIAGLTIGTVAALTSFLFNVVGSFLVRQDPMYILRVLGTFFLGEEALTTSDLTFLMLVALTHLSVGAAAGAVFHVVLNWKWPNLPTGKMLGAAVGFGIALWIFNFYVVLTWLQPMLVGEGLIHQLMPWWVALLTHVVYGLTLGLLQPVGRFVPYTIPAGMKEAS